MHRTIIAPLEQMRDYDFVQHERDVLRSQAALSRDILSGAALATVAGLVATQTTGPSLTINISSGCIYVLAPTDATAVGSIAQDTSTCVQQGINEGQQLTLTAPSAGQSRWNLIQCQFSQVDAVRAGDPNSGIVPFYNAGNPSVPTPTSVSTVRQGLCVLQVLQGSSATTGSEVPPNPTAGWTPLYLIDLAGGQTQITTAQCLRAGPSVGVGVPSNYQGAPFLAGLLAQHHLGVPGHAPKINLGTEVQGILPYANMSAVRRLILANTTIYVNNATGNDANDGLTAGSPFKTIQAALNAIYHSYDWNGFTCTVSVANATYAVTPGAGNYAVVATGVPAGLGSPINIVGNVGSPGSVTLQVTTGNGILSQFGANLLVQGITVTASGTGVSGFGVVATGGSQIAINTSVVGNCGSIQLLAQYGGVLTLSNGAITLTGSTPISMLAQKSGSLIISGSTVTFSALTVATAVVYAGFNGDMEALGNTFVGTPTGKRYIADTNGVIYTNGGGASYFPGTVAGTTASGGQYL